MVKRADDTVKPPKSQIDKFKETAKQVETDNSEEAFDRALKRVAKSPAPTKPKRQRA